MMEKSKKTNKSKGWQQFLVGKLRMLNEYTLAKLSNTDDAIRLDQGNVAEAEFRKWLQSFLPQKYGVTSGYLVCEADLFQNKLKHFDVIIYDKINCPTLWTKQNADKSKNGISKAVPIEYVHGILEVKSSLTVSNAKDAIGKLKEIIPYTQGVDSVDQKPKKFFPSNFVSVLVFFEINKKEASRLEILNEFIYDDRGFYGGVILSAEGKDRNSTGLVRLARNDQKFPKPNTIGGNLIDGWNMSPQYKSGNSYLNSILDWGDSNFAGFAFDLLAALNGTYRPGYMSSYHGVRVQQKDSF